MTLRELWDAGSLTLGGWCHIPSAFAAEVVARAGYDWVCIDMQHGLIGYEQMVHMLQALAITSTPAFVRVADSDPTGIMLSLDAGAQGVIVPMVSSPQEGAAVVRACRYPPSGNRSWGPIRAALGVEGLSNDVINHSVICCVMVETAEGVENIEAIAALPGIDAVFVGPRDLALSSGFPPSLEATDPRHRAQIDTVLRACKSTGVVAGTFCANSDMAAQWIAAGFKMLALSSDSRLLRHAAEQFIGAVRGTATPEMAEGRYI